MAKVSPGFKTAAELGLENGSVVTFSRALELGEEFLGPGYTEPIPGSGRYISAKGNGTRAFRMGTNDITGAHWIGPHVNFETLALTP